MTKHPMQPIEVDKQGVVRFKANAIIRWLCDSGKLDLNEIAIMPFSNEDHMQIAQLLGYSISGFGDLSYADKRTVAAADLLADKLIAELVDEGRK